MEKLFVLALAPTLIFLFYIYIRDKYEKEPLRLLFIGTLFGVIITFPIIQAETFMMVLMPVTGQFGEAVFVSFAVAALVEEAFKYAVLFFLTWRDRNLNERMDGIVYAVFISLGFAGVENILYVFNPQLGGLETAISRAIVSVPSHGFFGITMGYYFAMARFEPHRRKVNLLYAFFVTWMIHGIYDVILLTANQFYLFIFIPFLAIFWTNCFRKIKRHLRMSPFKN